MPSITPGCRVIAWPRRFITEMRSMKEGRLVMSEATHTGTAIATSRLSSARDGAAGGDAFHCSGVIAPRPSLWRAAM